MAYKIQKQVETAKRPGVGRVWQTVGTYKNRAVAERQAAYARLDARHQRPRSIADQTVRVGQ